jgi:PKD domain
MTQMLSLVDRATRLRAVVPLLLGWGMAACQPTDITNTTSVESAPAPASPAFADGERSGIPFGIWSLPTNEMGDLYTGAMRNIWPEELREELAEIKARGGRVVLMFAGNERHYKDQAGYFNLNMWKERVDRFRGVDFSDYVEDGTIIGHYLIDEPNDPANWNGRPVPGSTVETMAEYSKQLWPGTPTIVRTEPGYLARTGGPYRNLDAAWAQYVTTKGTPEDYIKRNVADAEKLNMALVTGLNIRKGDGGQREMSGSLIRSAGSTILGNGYACAFLSWEYEKGYLSRQDVREAMEYLAPLARNHPARSCRSRSEAPPPPDDDDGEDDDDDGEDDDGEEPEEPENRTPTAAFDAPRCRAGVACEFTDGSTDPDGSIAGRTWTFEPAGTSTEANPSMTFNDPGSYGVTLTVTDDAGATSSITRTVRVTRSSLSGSRPIVLNVSTYVSAGRQFVRLTWSDAAGATVRVLRNGLLGESTRNDRLYVRSYASRGPRSFTYRICEEDSTSRCSNTVTASLE